MLQRLTRIEPCKIHEFVTDVEGLPSNSASASDQWILTLSDKLNHEKAFIKVFVSPSIDIKDVLGDQLELEENKDFRDGLRYEMRIYKYIMNRIRETNISPSFTRSILEMEDCSYEKILKILTAAPDGDTHKNEIAMRLNRNILHNHRLDGLVTVPDSGSFRPPVTREVLQTEEVDAEGLNFLYGNRDKFTKLKFDAIAVTPFPKSAITLYDYIDRRLIYKNKYEFNEVIFHLMAACYVMSTMKFMHNDIHFGNIMVWKGKKRRVEYNYGDKVFVMPHASMYIYVYDFDRSYMGGLGKNPFLANDWNCPNACNKFSPGQDVAKIFGLLLRHYYPSMDTCIGFQIVKRAMSVILYDDEKKADKSAAMILSRDYRPSDGVSTPLDILTKYAKTFCQNGHLAPDVTFPALVEIEDNSIDNTFSQDKTRKIGRVERYVFNEKMAKELYTNIGHEMNYDGKNRDIPYNDSPVKPARNKDPVSRRRSRLDGSRDRTMARPLSSRDFSASDLYSKILRNEIKVARTESPSRPLSVRNPKSIGRDKIGAGGYHDPGSRGNSKAISGVGPYISPSRSDLSEDSIDLLPYHVPLTRQTANSGFDTSKESPDLSEDSIDLLPYHVPLTRQTANSGFDTSKDRGDVRERSVRMHPLVKHSDDIRNGHQELSEGRKDLLRFFTSKDRGDARERSVRMYPRVKHSDDIRNGHQELSDFGVKFSSSSDSVSE